MQKTLITAEDLAAHLSDPRWVVFDVRHDLADVDKGRRAYAAGHIPGAYFLHLDEDLSGPRGGRNGRHPLPGIGALARKLGDCGVGPDTQVVVYDETGGCYAVRLWWLMRWLGHEAVAVLDGGLPLWLKQGRPVEQTAPAPRKGGFVPRPMPEACVDLDYVARTRQDSHVKLVDARSADRYAGRGETLDPIGGHVPGAVNRFWQRNLRGDGRFRPAQELREEFLRLFGDADPAQSVHMCGSGVTACHNLFAMALAGLPRGRLYPGSWSEWCSDSSRPIAREA